MTRLCVLKVLKGHIQLLAKIYQPAKSIDEEGNVAWKVAIGQVYPLHNQKVRKSNEMIKVRHTDRQFYACAKRAQSTSWKEFIARNINGLLKSEIELLYPRWPLSAAVNADIRDFLAEATLDTADLD